MNSASIKLWRIIDCGFKAVDPSYMKRREVVDSKLNALALHMIQTVIGEENTSRKRLIGRKSCHGALPTWCATAKYAWRTVRGCATDSNLAVAQYSNKCATAKMGPGRPACAYLGVAQNNYVRHG